jgi:SPP1 gp7 family putative phage head morphogenesis protein
MRAKSPALRRLRAELTRRVARFLRTEAPVIAKQIAAARAKFNKAKLDQDEQDALERVLAEIDFSGWTVLVGDVEPLMEEIVKDGSYAALAELRFDLSGNAGVSEVVNADAEAYATERAAELVGMRYDELGRLVENPDAEWAITESTRAGLRQYVSDAISGGWSNDKLAAQIEDSYAFSHERAALVARTETNMASNAGALNGYVASGVVDGKQWLTAEDDLVSEDCQENGAAGPNGDGVLPLDEDYPSGDDAPPAHPNCRCTLAPYIASAEEAAAESTEETP